MNVQGVDRGNKSLLPSNGPYRDVGLLYSTLVQLNNLINQPQFHGSIRGNNFGGGGSAVVDLERLIGDLRVLLNDLAGKIDIAVETLDRLVNAREDLPALKAPVVSVEKEPR